MRNEVKKKNILKKNFDYHEVGESFTKIYRNLSESFERKLKKRKKLFVKKKKKYLEKYNWFDKTKSIAHIDLLRGKENINEEIFSDLI